MKSAKANIQTITLSLFLLSLVSFYLAYLMKPLPKEIFRLSFSPLNVETNALINLDENTITFQGIHQTLTIANLNPGILNMQLDFSGGVIVDADDLSLPSLLFEINNQPISIPVSSLVQTYNHSWVQMETGELTIQFQNFVKIEEQMYSLMLSDISIWKIQ